MHLIHVRGRASENGTEPVPGVVVNFCVALSNFTSNAGLREQLWSKPSSGGKDCCSAGFGAAGTSVKSIDDLSSPIQTLTS